MSNRDFASKQLNKINNRVLQAAQAANRDYSEISLIAASKQQTSQTIRAFHNNGLNHFGENYLQEARQKQDELQDLNLNWHFIGRLQSNKCKTIAEHFNWVHTVDRLVIAQRLARNRIDQATSNIQPLNLLIQLNVDQEQSKGGISLDSAPSLCAQISQLDGIQLRGFMLIPKPHDNFDQQRRPFALARETLEKVNQRHGIGLDSLSMGMSGDLEAAIMEGSTMIRIGSDLFGPRN